MLDCVEQLLLPGKEDRMFNRQSVSRLLESCLVVEVWSEGTLVGIARVPTNKLARTFREWTRGIGGGSQGKGGGGGVGRRQHIGAALCRALGREDLVGREKMRNFVNRLGDKKDEEGEGQEDHDCRGQGDNDRVG